MKNLKIKEIESKPEPSSLTKIGTPASDDIPRDNWELPDILSVWFWLRWAPLIIIFTLLFRLFFYLDSFASGRYYRRNRRY